MSDSVTMISFEIGYSKSSKFYSYDNKL